MWYFTKEEKQLKNMTRTFVQKEILPYASQHDNNETFNIQAFKKLGEIGLLGITVEPEYGGAGLGCLASTIVMEEIGRACASTALSYLAHSILCVNNIQNNANSEQKKIFLPKLVSGQHIGCMGMTEPEFGSDAIGIQTKATIKGENYTINGSKMWITNAQYADIAYVYTRTGNEKKNLTTFILEKNKNHFTVGKPIHKMGMRASPTGELIFDNVAVSKKNRVGAEGESTYHMMKNLEIERITISGISLGIAQACFEQSVKYANERKQFGKTIGNYQLIQKMIAEMAANIEMIKHFLYSAAKDYDLGNKGADVAAKVKLVIPQLVTKIALDAIQILGAYGYSREFPVERFMRDNKLNEIGAGTNEVMIMIIAKKLLELDAT
jgi:isovaleryl-CoA dehydrogenase